MKDKGSLGIIGFGAVLCAVLFQSGLCQCSAGRRQQQGSHGHHAGQFCCFPAGISVRHVPDLQRDPAHSHELSRRLAAVQYSDDCLLPQGPVGQDPAGEGIKRRNSLG